MTGSRSSSGTPPTGGSGATNRRYWRDVKSICGVVARDIDAWALVEEIEELKARVADLERAMPEQGRG